MAQLKRSARPTLGRDNNNNRLAFPTSVRAIIAFQPARRRGGLVPIELVKVDDYTMPRLGCRRGGEEGDLRNRMLWGEKSGFSAPLNGAGSGRREPITSGRIPGEDGGPEQEKKAEFGKLLIPFSLVGKI